MRVLWIAQNGGNYGHQTMKHSGSWIGTMQEQLIANNNDIDLGIVFLSTKSGKEEKEGRVTYMPILFPENRLSRTPLFRNLPHESTKDDKEIARLIKSKVDSYSPDIIHVWGVENNIAAVIPLLDRPYVVHIQGLASLYIDSYLPPGFSAQDINATDPWWNPAKWVKRILKIDHYSRYQAFKYQAEREKEVSCCVKNWIGRTEWDKNASYMLSPGSRYFHCEEIMRSDFGVGHWNYHHNATIVLQSTIGPQWYKGVDVILKTAAILKEKGMNVEWNIYGIRRDQKLVRYMSHKLGVSPEKTGVIFHGRVDGLAIRNALLACDAYVHPSYIENSSNAIAEAMMLGVPVIAQYVGGNPSMLKDGSGVLVPPNEPFILAKAIMDMRNKDIAEHYSRRASYVAASRQNSTETVETLIGIYKQVIESSNI